MTEIHSGITKTLTYWKILTTGDLSVGVRQKAVSLSMERSRSQVILISMQYGEISIRSLLIRPEDFSHIGKKKAISRQLLILIPGNMYMEKQLRRSLFLILFPKIPLKRSLQAGVLPKMGSRLERKSMLSKVQPFCTLCGLSRLF